MKFILLLLLILAPLTAPAGFYYWNFGKGVGSEFYWHYGEGPGSLYYWSAKQGPGSAYYWNYNTGPGSKYYWNNSRLPGSKYFWENEKGPGTKYYWENEKGPGSKYYWLNQKDANDVGVYMIAMCLGKVIEIEPCQYITTSPLNSPNVVIPNIQCDDLHEIESSEIKILKKNDQPADLQKSSR